MSNNNEEIDLGIVSKRDKKEKRELKIMIQRDKEIKVLEVLKEFGKLLLIKGQEDRKKKLFKKIKTLSIKLVEK
jgi:hypothetical protein